MVVDNVKIIEEVKCIEYKKRSMSGLRVGPSKS